MRRTALLNGLALFALHFAGSSIATADDVDNEPRSQAERITAIEAAAEVLEHCLASSNLDADPSQALQTLVEGLFNEDEVIAAAAVAALENLASLPYELAITGEDQEIRIEDPRALAMVRVAMLSHELMLDSTSFWQSCQSQILQDIPDMRKAGTWIAMAGDTASGLLFLQQLARDEDTEVQLWVVHMLWAMSISGIASPEYGQFAQDILQQLVGDDDLRVREAAFEALGFPVPVEFVIEDLYGTSGVGFTRPYPSGESPFSRKLMQMAASDDASEQYGGLRLLMCFDRQTVESQVLFVGLFNDAAGELESIDQSLIERSDEFPYLHVGDTQLRAFGILHRWFGSMSRLLDVVAETPEGVAAIRRLRDSLQIDERLWMECTIALLSCEQLTWEECREDVIAIISDNAQLVRDFSHSARLLLEDDLAGDIIADLDPHTPLLLAYEFANQNNDAVELASQIQAIDLSTDTRERALRRLREELPPEELVPILIEVLVESLPDEENDDPTLYLAALDGLTNLNHAAADQAIPVLIEHSHEIKSFMRHHLQARIIRRLGQIASTDDTEAVKALREHLHTGGKSIRTEAAFALARVGILDNEVLVELEWLETNGPFHLRQDYAQLLEAMLKVDD